MTEELCFWTAVRLREAIARREVSPVEVTRAVLDRAARLQPKLNCFITLCADEAMREAKAAEQAVMRGEATGLLHGIPYACKDLVNTRGVKTTFGSLLFADNVPAEDAAAIARLRRQGAILIGKTTTSEFGSKCLTDAPLFGRTRNAWHPDRTSGGSSGGAAVAVATGLAPIGIATDGGGSTRIPAACNGVVGLKQSIGLVPHSQAEDVIGNLTYVTPISRTVADTALMLQAMAGEDACDPWSAGAQAEDYLQAVQSARNLRGKRILFADVPSGRPISADVASCFESALGLLRDLGAELAEMPPASDFDIEPFWRTINHTVWKARFGKMAEEQPDRMSPSLLQQLALANDYTAVDYQEANFARTRLFRHVQALLRDHDFIVVPTLARTALPLDQDLFGKLEIDGRLFDEVRSNWFPWTMPFNLTGHPAITVPCGFGRDGLPIGLQLVGRLRQESDLLAAAAVFEAAGNLLARWPSLEVQ
ncbi:amidase [Variovorax soli]|uniref:Aspartyl-tRNA(Asn)/glutamyl-tRNA(Gln) amidotransferase subunit A n=1 Tax=Variovorax soli TaxID=376815 RepID=A0ABU1NDM4_9BURK|nr:amidase [Variovorax soli]MDR6536392.1 aspartyl-tRNA(Asn)/glutamyl-tRNA(Gln) amidotransferase subunit A [Variovorax soli]